MTKRKKLRPVGDILLDLEVLLEELVDQGLQLGDILALVNTWTTVHAPEAIEEYLDGSHPIFHYGPKK